MNNLFEQIVVDRSDGQTPSDRIGARAVEAVEVIGHAVLFLIMFLGTADAHPSIRDLRRVVQSATLAPPYAAIHY